MTSQKAKSNIVKDAMVLFVITLVAGLALGFVYEITKPVIEERALEAKTEAYKAVYKDVAKFVEDEELTDKIEESQAFLSSKGLNNITIDEVFVALDDSDNTLGHVMSVSTGEGYGGKITISLGYSMDGTVKGLEFLVLNETVGFGSRAAEPDFKDQFIEKQVTEFVATKSGAASENEIDALSGATITTEAVTGAVNAGILFLNEFASGAN